MNITDQTLSHITFNYNLSSGEDTSYTHPFTAFVMSCHFEFFVSFVTSAVRLLSSRSTCCIQSSTNVSISPLDQFSPCLPSSFSSFFLAALTPLFPLPLFHVYHFYSPFSWYFLTFCLSLAPYLLQSILILQFDWLRSLSAPYNNEKNFDRNCEPVTNIPKTIIKIIAAKIIASCM